MKSTLTLTDALYLPPEDWMHINARSLVISDSKREAIADTWAWLLGCADPVAEEEARHEARQDGELLVALASPATAFLDWFRVAEWECFAVGARSETTEWGWRVVDRARAEISRLGQHADEISMVSIIEKRLNRNEDTTRHQDISHLIESIKKGGKQAQKARNTKNIQ